MIESCGSWETIRCIGFNVHRLFQANRFASDDGTPVALINRYVERDEFRSFVCGVCSIWTRQPNTAIVRKISFMQYVEANWRGHSISWVNITPGIHSGLNPSCREAQIGPKRRRIDKDFDLERNIYLYPVVGGII